MEVYVDRATFVFLNSVVQVNDFLCVCMMDELCLTLHITVNHISFTNDCGYFLCLHAFNMM